MRNPQPEERFVSLSGGQAFCHHRDELAVLKPLAPLGDLPDLKHTRLPAIRIAMVFGGWVITCWACHRLSWI